MAALVVDIAEAIKNRLQTSGLLPDGATVERAYVPPYEVAKVGTGLRVYVTPAGLETGRGNSRTALACAPMVWVCVMQRLTQPMVQAEVDGLLLLTQQMATYLYGLDELVAGEQITVGTIGFVPLVDPAWLVQGIYQGALEIECQTYLEV